MNIQRRAGMMRKRNGMEMIQNIEKESRSGAVMKALAGSELACQPLKLR
jgi:hypothetical protein